MDNCPPEFICPITRQIFDDPVIASDGNVYEKEAITDWFKEKSVSPLTNLPINLTISPIHFLKSAIDNFIFKNSQLKDQQYVSTKTYKKYKPEVINHIKNRNFKELLNYREYDYNDLKKRDILCCENNQEIEESPLYYTLKYCDNIDVLTHIHNELRHYSNAYGKIMFNHCSEECIIEFIKRDLYDSYFITNYSWNIYHFLAKRNFIKAFILTYRKYRVKKYMKTKNKFTPLMVAIKFKSFDVTSFLIKNKKSTDTEIKYAIKNKIPVNFLFDMIIHSHNNPNKFLDNILKYYQSKDTIDFLKSLLSQHNGIDKIDFDFEHSGGNSILHLACEYSSFKVIKFLIDNCQSLIDYTNYNKETPWMFALKYKKFNAFKYMFQKGIDTNLSTNMGSKLSHWLAQQANMDSLKYVLKTHKLDFTEYNDLGYQPINYALTRKFPNMTTFILNQIDTNKKIACYAIKHNKDIEIQKQILLKIKDWDNKEKDIKLINSMARYSNAEIIKIIIEKGIDLELTTKNNQKLIHLLCEYNRDEDLIKYLVDIKNVDIESTDKWGFKPLHYVCLHGTIDLIKFMIEKTKDHNTNIDYFDDETKYDNLMQLLKKNNNVIDIFKEYFQIK